MINMEDYTMNENIKKFYDKKVAELEKANQYMSSMFGDKVELAVDVFRTRYSTCLESEDAEYQARYTSNQCLKVVFGRTIDDDAIDMIQAYDCLRDHISTIKSFLNDDTA